MASEIVKYVTDGSFKAEVEQSDVPVLIDFTATWCGPCKALAPIIDRLAQNYGPRLKVMKLDIDDSPETPARFGIRGVPTVIVFKGGKEVGRQVGLAPENRLTQLIEPHVSGN